MKIKVISVVFFILTSVSGALSQCSDLFAGCPGWKSYCGSILFSQIYCKKSCGTCSSPGSGVWGSWGQFGPCDKQCGGGTRTRTRTCNPPGQCTGSGTDSEPCNQNPCTGCEDLDRFCEFYKVYCTSSPYVRQSCKKTCNDCSDPGPTNPEWNMWGGYSACTKQCGGGTQTRTRTCNIPNQCTGSSSETINCNIQPCPVAQWSTWSSFSQCSKTCGGGEKKRTRTCTVSGQCPGNSEESMSCNEQTCPVPCTNSNGDWYCELFRGFCSSSGFKNGCRKTCNACEAPQTGVWNNWSNWGQCSKTCGGGQSTRTRTCQSGDCSGDSTESRSCNEQDCPPGPSWGNWGGWSQCNQECGGGQETRTRVCSVTNACSGTSVASRPCNEHSCDTAGDWSNWDQWGECSVLCGSGQQTRTRQCNFNLGCGAGSSTESKSCNTEPCQTNGNWQTWSSWSGCTVTCGGGVQERTRMCDNSGCPGPAREERTCEEQPCPVSWNTWSQWSTCDATCGGGESVRTRQCSPINVNCPGTETEKRNCNDFLCLLEWNNWGTYGSCSKTCGLGQRIRTRSCPTVNRCLGSATQVDSCNEGACSVTGSWSPCSKTCGYGTRYIVNSGVTTYQSCNVQDCAQASCVGQTRRRGVPWSCCSVTAETCGQSVIGGRIIGGQTSDAKEWPFMASLAKRQTSTSTQYFHSCGAVIISRQWVLTAGHCLVSSTTRVPFSIELMRIYAGIVSLTLMDTQASYADVEQAIPHPSLYFPENDIGLIKLKTLLPDNDFIKPVCLPGGEVTPQDTKCFIMGWGTTIPGDGTQASPNLMDAEVYNFNLDVCRSVYTTSNNFATFVRSSSNILCAGTFTEGVDTCLGDSGGPLICQRCTSCNMYVAGIVSFGPLPCATQNMPGIYTKVLAYQNWIQTETRLRPSIGTCPTTVGP